MANKEAQRLKRERIIEENGIIFLDNVSKSYSTGSPALNGVTLSIGRGEFVFIVGDSGSGKSTLIKLLLRELTATSGSVYVMGNDLARLKHRQIPRFRRNLGVVFQDFRLLNDRNVYENVAFAQRIVETPVSEIRRNVPAILATVGLAGKYKAKTKQLSGGEQQMLAMGRALMSHPKLLMLDEPSMGLAPLLVEQIFDIIRQLHADGTTILLVEQNAQMALSVADRAYVLETGRIVTEGTGAALLESDAIKKAYLGG